MSQAIWEVITPADEAADAAQDAAVSLSAEGLRRAYDENGLLRAAQANQQRTVASKCHEIFAAVAAGLLTVVIVFELVRNLAGG